MNAKTLLAIVRSVSGFLLLNAAGARTSAFVEMSLVHVKNAIKAQAVRFVLRYLFVGFVLRYQFVKYAEQTIMEDSTAKLLVGDKIVKLLEVGRPVQLYQVSVCAVS